MKRIAIILFISLTAVLALGAIEPHFEQLSAAQRYDLAHAYDLVADKFDDLDDAERADSYRKMVQVLFPGYGEAARPETLLSETPPVRPVSIEPDPSGESACDYYFVKLLRGVFNEDTILTTSVLADTLFLPLFDKGIDKALATSELEWFFSEYDLTGIAPYDVFDMEGIQKRPLDNGYWRLDVETQPGYENAVPEVTFWSGKMGFYFRRFPEGWRLAAIGPVA